MNGPFRRVLEGPSQQAVESNLSRAFHSQVKHGNEEKNEPSPHGSQGPAEPNRNPHSCTRSFWLVRALNGRQIARLNNVDPKEEEIEATAADERRW